MKSQNEKLTLIVMCVIASATHAQTWQRDGDHMVTNTGGRSFLAPDSLLGILVQPLSLNVGTLPGAPSLLTVSGHHLGSGEVFRTQSNWGGTGLGLDSHWRMYRDVNKIGAIWNEGNHRVWHVQSLEQRDVGADRYSGLMLQNEANDGIWVMNAGAPTG